MTKEQIEQIRIDVKADGEIALSMLIHKDGTLNRQGNGALPAVKLAAIGMTDGLIFKKLISELDANLLAHAGVYDHPDKNGQQLIYTLAFIGQKPNIKVFEFRVGSETKDVGDVLPYVDNFISKAAQLTNDWYNSAQENKSTTAKKSDQAPLDNKKPWFKFW